MGSRITAVCSLVVIAAAGVAHCAVAEDGEAPQTAWTCAGAGRVPVALGAAKGIEAWVDCPRTDGWRLEVVRDDGEAAGVELVRVRLMSDRPAKRPRFEIGFRKVLHGEAEMFFGNLLLGTDHELKNRYLRIGFEYGSEAAKCLENAERTVKTRDRVMALIKNDPRISISAMSRLLKISRSTVQKHVDVLKSTVGLAHQGPRKGGRWTWPENRSIA